MGESESIEMLQCDSCGNDQDFTVYVTHKVHRNQSDSEVTTEVLGENVDIITCDECNWVVYLDDFDQEELSDLRDEEEEDIENRQADA